MNEFTHKPRKNTQLKHKVTIFKIHKILNCNISNSHAKQWTQKCGLEPPYYMNKSQKKNIPQKSTASLVRESEIQRVRSKTTNLHLILTLT